MLKKYSYCGVKYVEFAVGWSDIVERPWVFHELTAKVERSGVDYNFLAGFGRNEVVFNEKVEKSDGYGPPAPCCEFPTLLQR
jgi:hypothetical protein